MAIEKLGKYPVEGELGRGGMGVVYKSTDPDTGAAVAVKVLPAQLAGDPVFVNRFRREMITLQRLQHPGVVRILDQGEQDEGYYYVMEYMDGGSLETKLKEGMLDPLAATRMVLPVSRVLEHLHAQGVIHRDLKPANILLTKEGESKLTDFGIAKLVDATRMTATQSMLGTVEYMSPEQSQGRFVDPRTDIYSLGVIYYRALTGRMPVTGKTAPEIITNLRLRQIEKPTEWMPDLPEYVSDLVMHMLEKDAAKRVPSAKALTRELERVEQRLIEAAEGKKAEGSAKRVPAARSPARGKPTTAGKPVSPLRNVWPIGIAVLLLVGVAAVISFSTRPPAAATRMKAAREYIDEGSVAGNKLAEEQLQALVGEHPDSELVAEAKELLAWLKEREVTPGMVGRLWNLGNTAALNKNRELARDIYKLIAAHFPETKEGKLSAGRAAEIEHEITHPIKKPVRAADATKTAELDTKPDADAPAK